MRAINKRRLASLEKTVQVAASGPRDPTAEEEAWLRRVLAATDDDAAELLLERPMPYMGEEWSRTHLSQADGERLYYLLGTLGLPTKATVSIRGLSVEEIEELAERHEAFDVNELAELSDETLYRLNMRMIGVREGG
jgi:hypothetical protein